jgi:DNA-binding response OmpR family regulator
MLTARRDKKDIEHAIALGVDDYIVKPIDPMLLIKKSPRTV